MAEITPAVAAAAALFAALGAAAVAGLLATRPKSARLAHLPVIAAFALGFACSLFALAGFFDGSGASAFETESVTWFSAGSFRIDYALRVDPISATMLAVVTGIGTLIAVFSASYMHHDEGFARYFALMALFVFSMLLLVLAPNFLLMVAGWEGVGVCSYLLVGYYYARPSAAQAARKAFLVTRLGDVGMILGIMYLWQLGGQRTNFQELFEYLAAHPETHAELTIAALLLFCGAVGKSAQLPLYVWLPDAMEGPTPVSALIHAATMVTAGVYLLARCAPIFALAPAAQLVVAVIGGLTALVAGFIALGQHDLKRVLAYSTVSQLGFMFMALGCGGVIAPTLAVTAALFHLVTHAFFKALLFLGSGSVMHAMGDVIDMRRFGGLRKLMPVTHWTFLAGALALAGIPLFSGFWSKDQILDALLLAGESGKARGGYYFLILGVGLFTAGLTAFYTFRAYFLTFHGELRVPEEAGDHAHESPAMMRVPLIILAVGALIVGLLLDPATHGFASFVARTPSLVLADELAAAPHKPLVLDAGNVLVSHDSHAAEMHFNLALAAISSAVALLGVLLAWQMYGNGGPEVVPAGLRTIYSLSRHKLYVDEIYGALLVKPAEGFAAGSRQFDVFLDGLARLVSFAPRFGAAILRPLQNGLVQFYALGMVLGLAVFVAVVVVRSGW